MLQMSVLDSAIRTPLHCARSISIRPPRISINNSGEAVVSRGMGESHLPVVSRGGDSEAKVGRIVGCGVTMGWLLRLVTGGPIGGRVPPTVLFYFKSEGRGPVLRK